MLRGGNHFYIGSTGRGRHLQKKERETKPTPVPYAGDSWRRTGASIDLKRGGGFSLLQGDAQIRKKERK